MPAPQDFCSIHQKSGTLKRKRSDKCNMGCEVICSWRSQCWTAIKCFHTLSFYSQSWGRKSHTLSEWERVWEIVSHPLLSWEDYKAFCQAQISCWSHVYVLVGLYEYMKVTMAPWHSLVSIKSYIFMHWRETGLETYVLNLCSTKRKKKIPGKGLTAPAQIRI